MSVDGTARLEIFVVFDLFRVCCGRSCFLGCSGEGVVLGGVRDAHVVDGLVSAAVGVERFKFLKH